MIFSCKLLGGGGGDMFYVTENPRQNQSRQNIKLGFGKNIVVRTATVAVTILKEVPEGL